MFQAKSVQWLGDSRGRWEGDTLVIDTTNFINLPPNEGTEHFRGATGNLHLIERLTRVGPDKIDWSVTLDKKSVNVDTAVDVHHAAHEG